MRNLQSFSQTNHAHVVSLFYDLRALRWGTHITALPLVLAAAIVSINQHDYSALVTALQVASQYPRISVELGCHKKAEVRCSPRDEARWTSGAPSVAAGLYKLIRSRGRAGSTHDTATADRKVTPHGGSLGEEKRRTMDVREGREGREVDKAGERWKFASFSVAWSRAGAEIQDPRRALPLRPVAILLSRA